MKKLFKFLLILLAVILAAAVIYLLYVILSYDRIPDRQALTPRNPQEVAASASTDREYTVVTQNIGFGAYTDDFTFFMDGGTQSWAASPQSVTDCVNEAAQQVSLAKPDFVLFQEVDFDSSRSYHIDQQ